MIMMAAVLKLAILLFFCLLPNSVVYSKLDQPVTFNSCKYSVSGLWKYKSNKENKTDRYFRLHVHVDDDQSGSTSISSSEIFFKSASKSHHLHSNQVEKQDVTISLHDTHVKVVSTDECYYGKVINCGHILWEDGNSWVKVQDINHVHIVYMNHLDVGYNGLTTEKGFVNNVLNQYFNIYYPRAIRIANTLRLLGGNETFIYTTHPWLVSLYLDCPPSLELAGIKLICPSKEDKNRFKKAVKRGDITWHAGPMNLQTDNIDKSLFEYSLTISEDLDKRFGIVRKNRVLSQRDVPGITQTVIPSLLKHGIQAVSVGVNSMSSPPAVPNPFIWKYYNDSVLAMWHPGGYPDSPGTGPLIPGGLSRDDCVIVDGFDHALCFAFRTDNRGPPLDALEVISYYRILNSEFPGAHIAASTFEDYVTALLPFKDKLPVITNEIGDTWIQGIMSDPKKMAQYRTLQRTREECLLTGDCKLSDTRITDSSRFLLKVAEHTYGLNSVDDITHWTNEELKKARSERRFEEIELSWSEQREFIQLSIDALQDHPLKQTIEQRLQELEPNVPNTTGYGKISVPTGPVSCDGNVTIRLGRHGEIIQFHDKNTNIDWAKCSSDNCALGLMMYHSYNDTDINSFSQQYNFHGSGGAGFHKTGMTKLAHPQQNTWIMNVQEMWQKQDGSCSFITKLSFPDNQSWVYYGAPKVLWTKMEVTQINKTTGIDIEINYFNKTSTRLPESMMYNFFPAAMAGYQWKLYKMGGGLVDPMNVVLNGSQMLHGIQDGVRYSKPGSHGIKITSPDIPVVGIVTENHAASPYTVPLNPLSVLPLGMAYNFFNNIWDTNYILWYPFQRGDESFKARFRLSLL